MQVRVGVTLVVAYVVMLILGASASAQVLVEHSGWVWSNPTPQGEPLNDISFAGGVGYAVGDFGTALRTADGGKTWTALPTGLFGNLMHVDAVSADTVILGGACVLRRSDDGGSTFVRLPWTASEASCPAQIAAIDFPTSATGYLLLSDGTILRTRDGGQSWARATAPPTPPGAIVFSSATSGVAAGNGIYLTTDGGNTWTTVDALVNPIRALALDGATGIVAYGTGPIGGGGTSLYTSADGGHSWTASPVGGVYGFGYSGAHLSCAGASRCLLSGSGAVFLTTAGTAFENVTPTGVAPNAAAFDGPTQAVAVTQEGIPAVSTDGGATFSESGSRLPSGVGGLRAGSGALATLSGPGGELALTVDGGGAWTVLDTPSSNPIEDASFVSATTGFALDSSGAVLSTADGGATWDALSSEPGESRILALNADDVLLAGFHGIERSVDGGQRFAAVLGGQDIDELAPAGSAIVASGATRAYVSSTGGAGWRPIRLPRGFPRRGDAIRQLAFRAAATGYLLATDGRVFATTDGGKRWSELYGLGHGAIRSIAFTSARNGWAAEGNADGTPGEVLRTSDGGRSWRPQRVSAGQIDELAAGGSDGYALDDGGDVFASGSGGDLGSAASLSLRGPRKAARHGRVTVSGRLAPAPAGASIEINYRAVAGGRWVHRFVTAGAGGTFVLSVRIARATAFVAQWSGDLISAGAGSSAVIVHPR